MPTEKETREAIAAVIALVAPDAVVVPRDQSGLLAKGVYTPLTSPTTGKIRGWVITQSGAPLIEQGQAWGDYRYTWRLVQIHEYKTGDATTNSEDGFASERENVLRAFLNPAGVVGITQDILDDLGDISGASFPVGSIGSSPMAEGASERVHIADGSISCVCKVGVCA